MKMATVRQLRNQYTQVIGWVEAGEEVLISRRGKAIARLIPESRENVGRVDWSKSAAALMDKSSWPELSAEESAALVAESQGRY